MSIVGTVIVVATAINNVASFAQGVMTAFNKVKQAIESIRSVDMQRVWGSATNSDSKVFNDRMIELENDIKKAYDILNEYEQLLQRSAKEYENRQQEVQSNASNLKSPTGR